MFINIKTRSYYSMMYSSISIDDIIKNALDNKQTYACCVDVNVMYGALEFYTKAIANKIKPIIGLSVFVNTKEVTLLAKNYKGYIALCKISTLINHNNEFKLEDYASDDLIVITELDLKGFNNLYKPNELAAHEALFVNKQDYSKYKALVAINSNLLYDEVSNDEELAKKYLLSEEEANNFYSKEQIVKTQEIINSIDLVLPLNKENHFVKFNKDQDSYYLLRERCRQGIIRKLGEKVQRKYIERLNYELDIIHKMGFDDYFLVVQDYVAYAKQNNIAVGPGRGSAAGSLVSYVLDITEVDPLEYGLIFERFLNSQRQTKPDIDIDFMDNRRGEIFDYLFTKYGHNKTAHIVTFQKIKAKTSIRDIGRILNIDLTIINLICKSIPDYTDVDFKTMIEQSKALSGYKEKYPLLFDLATFMYGLPRQTGTHAAGVVICNQELSNIIPTTLSAEGTNTTQYSMEYIESCGLIKMDILGLVNLSIISDCIDEINKHAEKKFNIREIPLDDQKVFKQLSKGNTIGIFQLESGGMTNLIKKIQPKCIEDISACSALFRPGPQDNIPLFLKNRRDTDHIEYISDKLIPILEPTYGIIVYQEQVIETLCTVANWTLAQADIVRRAISKKKIDKLASIEKDFIESSIKNGYKKEEAQKIFDYILKFASYGFNHSHSICYSLISYQLAYLKTYYLLEFYACLLTYNNGAMTKVNTYLAEAKANGIIVIPPSINHSKQGFGIYDRKIIFGFASLKGIGIETLNKILKAKAKHDEFKSLNDAIKALVNEGVTISALEILTKAGCFDELFDQQCPNRISLLTSLENVYNSFKDTTSKYGQIGSTSYVIVENNEQNIEQSKKDQFAILGIYFDKHPIIALKEKYQELAKQTFSLNYIIENGNYKDIYKTIVLVNQVRKIKTKTGLSMAFVNIEDETRIVPDATSFGSTLTDPEQIAIFDKGKFVLMDVVKTTKSLKILKVREELK